MKLPRDLKGSDLAKTLCRDWAYRVVHQEGTPKMHHLSSHIFHDGLEKLQRGLDELRQPLGERSNRLKVKRDFPGVVVEGRESPTIDR
jgi:hypothetical protein